jgi:hypothetical protein
MFSFSGVTVGLPAGGPAACDGNWVPWSTGELRVDSASFSLCFVPSLGSNAFTPKPLGCLLSANVVPGDPGGSSYIVASTNDVIHSFVRFTFERCADEETFMRMSRTVEAKRSAANPRRSSLNGPPQEWNGIDPIAEQLADTIREHCQGAWPLIYGGAELYGQGPGCHTEVLLGRGAIVLLDPPETLGGKWTGNYELFFYEETSGSPLLHVPVGPNVKLSLQPEAEAHPGRLSVLPRLSMARRTSMGPAVAACFDFSVHGVGVSALSFDREIDAQSFVRDLTVRLRLTKAALKAKREVRSADDLAGELFTLQQSSLAARAWRVVVGLAVMTLTAMLVYTCILYFSEDRSLTDVIVEVVGTTFNAAGVLGVAAQNFGSVACRAIHGGRTLPTSAVDACAAIPFAQDAHACIQELAR